MTFKKNRKQINTDLFNVIVSEDKLHPLFKQVLDIPAYAKTHSIINSWGAGLLGRSGETLKFIKEFQTTFSSSFWELYLNKAFKNLEYEIDYSKASPDFNLIGSDGRTISVEAVTANSQDMRELTSIQADEEFFDASVLKLAGKIRDKLKLYLGDGKKKHPYCTLKHVKDRPFVLAVAPFDRQLAQSQNNTAINKVLYGLEPPKNVHIPQEAVEFILNRNGQKVDVGIFTNDSYKEISAVIFSTTGTVSKALVEAGSANYIRATKLRRIGIVEFMAKEGMEKLGVYSNDIAKDCTVNSGRRFEGFDVSGYDTYYCVPRYHEETHLDGLQVYHNPYALHPLAKEDFKSPEVVHCYYDIKDRQMLMDYSDGALVSRNAIVSIDLEG